ncbi:protein kinase domain-containing protein [Undibacterium sp. Di24W]|uniref:protein kinase domain-containing protein n=1 Tax=Undibacterium sp. Di24W TaxID=3413033 RepID=UPI003BF0963E
MSLINSNHSQSALSDADDGVISGTFKHYEIRAKLSSTLSTQVFEAWDTQLHRLVAIKQIKQSHSIAQAQETLIKEARLAASLKHAAFVKIHALEEAQDSLFIVMELVTGVRFSDWIKEHHGKDRLILGIVLQLASAMQEAHAAGLIHGDIKPSNLIVDGSGKVRILNFGLVSQHEIHPSDVPDLSDPHNSIPYMAAERFANSKATAAGDVFALGIIWYEMLNGALPFAELHGLALVAAQVQTKSEQWPWSKSILDGQKKIILSMTDRDAGKRIGSAQVVTEIKSLTANDPLSNSSASLDLAVLREQIAKKNQQRRRNLVVMFALLFSLCGIAAWQSKPYWPQIAKAIKPYSESREMEQGIALLTQHMYRPDLSKLDAASEHFMNVLERTPEHAAAVAYMSIVYISRYHAEKRDEIWLQKSKASAQQAMKLNPNLAISLVADAKILHWHHKLDLALEAADKALVLEPKNLFAWHTKMSSLFESNRYGEAIAWAEQGAKIFPEDRFLLDMKGGTHLAQHDYKLAETALRMSLTRQPDSANGYALLAQAIELQGRTQEALQVIQQGLQVRPNAYLYATLGNIKFKQQDFAAAAAAFGNAASPERGVTGSYFRWFELAEALMWVPGREKEGIAAYEKAKKLLEIRLNRSPDDEVLLVEMSMILARLGDFSQAKVLALQALKIAPNHPDRLFFAGLTFELIGERERALDAILKAKKLGFSLQRIETHPILKGLRSDSRFK